MVSSGAATRSDLMVDESAADARARRRTSLILTGRRIVLDHASVVPGKDVRKRLGINERNAVIGRKDGARCARQRAQHAGRSRQRRFSSSVLVAGGIVTGAMTNGEQTTGRCVWAGCCLRSGYSGQQQLERERVGRRHGDPWPHPLPSFAQLQHGIPRRLQLSLRVSPRKISIHDPPISAACVMHWQHCRLSLRRNVGPRPCLRRSSFLWLARHRSVCGRKAGWDSAAAAPARRAKRSRRAWNGTNCLRGA